MRCLRPRVGAAGGSDTDPSSPGAPPGSFLGKVRPGRQEVCGPHAVHPLGPGEEVLSWEDTTEQRGLGARGAGKGGRSAPAPAPRRLQGCHAGALGSFYFPSFGPAVPQVWLREALSAPNCSGRQREPAFEGGTRCVCQHVPAAADSADSGPGDAELQARVRDTAPSHGEQLPGPSSAPLRMRRVHRGVLGSRCCPGALIPPSPLAACPGEALRVGEAVGCRGQRGRAHHRDFPAIPMGAWGWMGPRPLLEDPESATTA